MRTKRPWNHCNYWIFRVAANIPQGHTYAVLSLQNGDDVKMVQENLGHATAAFTLDVHGHVSEHMKEASAQRMQKYIENMG